MSGRDHSAGYALIDAMEFGSLRSDMGEHGRTTGECCWQVTRCPSKPTAHCRKCLCLVLCWTVAQDNVRWSAWLLMLCLAPRDYVLPLVLQANVFDGLMFSLPALAL